MTNVYDTYRYGNDRNDFIGDIRNSAGIGDGFRDSDGNGNTCLCYDSDGYGDS